MTKILIITSLIIFNSCKTLYCNTTPKIAPIERCAISIQFNKCRCVMFDLMTMENVSDGYDMPFNYCEDRISFSFEDYATKIKPWALESRRAYNDYCL